MTDQPVRARKDTDGRARDLTRPPAPEPLPVAVADSHCHLDIADRDGDTDAWWTPRDAIEAAAAVGIARIVQVGCELESARWSVRVAREHPELVAAVALHPNEAPRLAALGQLDAALAEIADLAADPVVRAVGETGLDYFRTDEAGRNAQHASFREHIRLAKYLGKTLQIHDREAHEDVLRILEEECAPERVVFHCFSGDAAMARYCAERGYFLSYAGTVTFTNAQPLRDALAVTPRELVLVETDAPFLTPVPFRGRTNASYLIPFTVRTMAEVRGEELAELCTALADNTARAFGGVW